MSNVEHFLNTSSGNLKRFNPFPFSPFWAVTGENWIKCTNTALVRETLALVFISIEFSKHFKAYCMECSSNGATLPRKLITVAEKWMYAFNVNYLGYPRSLQSKCSFQVIQICYDFAALVQVVVRLHLLSSKPPRPLHFHIWKEKIIVTSSCHVTSGKRSIIWDKRSRC